MHISSIAPMLTALLLVCPVFPARAVIFSGETFDVRFSASSKTAEATWSGGWQMTGEGLALQRSDRTTTTEWIRTAQLPVGNGRRHGTGFTGLVSVECVDGANDPIENSGEVLECEFRISEGGRTWSEWKKAEPATTEPRGCMSPSRATAAADAFQVDGQITGPPDEVLRALMARQGVPAPQTGSLRDALPREFPPVPAGYLQVRLRPRVSSGVTVRRVLVSLSTVTSGLKP